MNVLITGASSGIGREMAKIFISRGDRVIVVARRSERLNALCEMFPNGNIRTIVADLSLTDECLRLYEEVKNENIDYLINNAGFGLFGSFLDTPIEDELKMIQVNDCSPQILMKLFLKDFVKRGSGNVLNVCSSAAFYTGPFMATYYSSKSYIYKMSLAVNEELRRMHSNVHISALCPGPVATEFQTVAKVHFNVKPLTPEYIAKYAIKKFLKNKTIIIPGCMMRMGKFFSRFVSDKQITKMSYHFQMKKIK